MNNDKRNAWRCPVCRVTPQSPQVCEEPALTLTDLYDELKTSRTSIESKIDGVEQQVIDLNNKWSSLESRLAGMEERISTTEDKMETLSTLPSQIKDLQEQVACLKKENNERDQFGRQNNLEITGVPSRSGENLRTILNNICTKVGFVLDQSDIDCIHRIRVFSTEAKHQNLRPPSIIVRFTRRVRRDELLAAARARRGLTTADAGLDGPSTNIYLNEHLTPANKMLLKRAREVKSELNYSYVWVKEGKIFVRKNDTSRVIRIVSESDLLKLK
ncbi:uncharacterized protein LOC125231392 [Leguminivora glycinivorella]|uniref:uncharacterized protein LOC125231392 n=1 Tax=Leguminivora glycinivorella TaxID=1035111 RepID=UPI00200FB9D1|nr:uncharacterized protein LOC125231392 [Leguminivora glycinivorella]